MSSWSRSSMAGSVPASPVEHAESSLASTSETTSSAAQRNDASLLVVGGAERILAFFRVTITVITTPMKALIGTASASSQPGISPPGTVSTW